MIALVLKLVIQRKWGICSPVKLKFSGFPEKTTSFVCNILKNSIFSDRIFLKMHTPKLFAILAHLEKKSGLRGLKRSGPGSGGTWNPAVIRNHSKNRSRLSEIDGRKTSNHSIFPQRSVKYVSNLLSTILIWTELLTDCANQLKPWSPPKDLAILRWYNERGLYPLPTPLRTASMNRCPTKKHQPFSNPLQKCRPISASVTATTTLKNEVGPSISNTLFLHSNDFVINSSLVFCELSNWGQNPGPQLWTGNVPCCRTWWQRIWKPISDNFCMI